MLKGKVGGGGGEAITQRPVHDEDDVKVGGGGGEAITQRPVHDEDDASAAVMGQPLKHIQQFDLSRFHSKNRVRRYCDCQDSR